jgi:hypothetical protein
MSRIGNAMLVCALVALALVAARVALADSTFADPAGDSAGAPDITAVKVANDAAGNLTFTVTTNQAALAADGMLDLEIDADRNSTTGGDGVEYAFLLDSTGWVLLHWNGSSFVEASASSANASYANSVGTFKVGKADLGNINTFSFYFYALQIGADEKVVAYDEAPDGTAVYDYTLTAPPAPAPASTPLTLQTGKPIAMPKPAAGKRFVVSMAVVRGDTGAPLSGGTVTCKVTVGLKPLKATGSVTSGVASCGMRIPATAHGKKVRGTIKVTFRGVSASRSFAYTVA